MTFWMEALLWLSAKDQTNQMKVVIVLTISLELLQWSTTGSLLLNLYLSKHPCEQKLERIQPMQFILEIKIAVDRATQCTACHIWTPIVSLTSNASMKCMFLNKEFRWSSKQSIRSTGRRLEVWSKPYAASRSIVSGTGLYVKELRFTATQPSVISSASTWNPSSSLILAWTWYN